MLSQGWLAQLRAVFGPRWKTRSSAVLLSPTFLIRGARIAEDVIPKLDWIKLRLTYSEADLQADAYISRGFVLRDNLYLDSLKAMRDIATAMERQLAVLIAQTEPPTPIGDGEREPS